ANVAQVSGTALANLHNNVTLAVEGALTLNLNGFILATGTFDLGVGTVPSVSLSGGGTLTDADLLTLSLSDAELFAGTGGIFAADPHAAQRIDTSNAIGFYVGDANLKFASLKPNKTDIAAGDGRSWTVLTAQLGLVSLAGLPDILSFSASNVSILYNS